MQDAYHLPVRNSTCPSQGRENNYEEKGPVSKYSPTLELVNKKKVRNAREVVDDVRYDCVGHWPVHTEKKQLV